MGERNSAGTERGDGCDVGDGVEETEDLGEGGWVGGWVGGWMG